MKKLSSVARALAFVGLAALVAGCKTTSTQTDTTDNIPNDYRLRHPIAVREKAQTLTVFIGDRRGGLTPTQRAEVGATAASWRRDATGGIVIETPVGGSNTPAAHSAAPEIRAILRAAGRAPRPPKRPSRTSISRRYRASRSRHSANRPMSRPPCRRRAKTGA